jgi:hypothetical protein
VIARLPTVATGETLGSSQRARNERLQTPGTNEEAKSERSRISFDEGPGERPEVGNLTGEY